MSLVLDSSATLAWTFREERTDAILNLFNLVANHGAVVPELWRIEVANALNVGIRRARITKDDRRGILSDLGDLPIFIDNESRNHVWGDTLSLADKHNLTVYDAIYLELACAFPCPWPRSTKTSARPRNAKASHPSGNRTVHQHKSPTRADEALAFADQQEASAPPQVVSRSIPARGA